jgi:superfamily II DNA or RNA helicase
MMHNIVVHPFNAVYDKIETEPSIAQEMAEYFSFKVENWEFIRRKKPHLKHWDGSIHLFNKQTGKLYVGLRSRLQSFAKDREFSLHIPEADVEFSMYEAQEFIKTLNLPIEPRFYQIKAFVRSIRKRRILILSPTSSGKSLLLYLIIRYYLLHGKDRILLIVPTLNLIHQMYSDFKEYGYDVGNEVHLIYEGQEKTSDKPVWISTWQSIYNQPREYFEFDAIIVDEAHHAQSESIRKVMEASSNTDLRIGCTGTLNDTLTHRLTLEGLFGEVFQATTTKELMDHDFIAKLKIKSIILRHKPEDCQYVSTLDYAGELEYLSQHTNRNKFIQNLAFSLKGNTLILFRLVDKGGKILYNQITRATDRPVYFIHGQVPGEEREKVRKIVQTFDNAIMVGSYGTVSTGINWPSLRYIIAAAPYKGRIKVLQSIGRGLRLDGDNKIHCTVYDIADDFTWKNKSNTTLDHFVERVRIYNEEEFQYQIYKVDLG